MGLGLDKRGEGEHDNSTHTNREGYLVSSAIFVRQYLIKLVISARPQVCYDLT